MAIGNINKNGRTVLSEINVTPFVDVMLVLLVIFMVTTPILYQGVNVNLPKATSKPIPSLQNDKKLMITLTKSGEIYIEDDRYLLSDIGKVRDYEINSWHCLIRELYSTIHYEYIIIIFKKQIVQLIFI